MKENGERAYSSMREKEELERVRKEKEESVIEKRRKEKERKERRERQEQVVKKAAAWRRKHLLSFWGWQGWVLFVEQARFSFLLFLSHTFVSSAEPTA